MKVGEAQIVFLSSLAERLHQEPTLEDFTQSVVPALDLFASRFANRALDTLTPVDLRDFLSHWYVEEFSTQVFQQGHPACPPSPQSDMLPDAENLLAALSAFFNWLGETANLSLANEHLAILSELEQTLACAIEISVGLLKFSAGRGGAFNFPEFLTSFEEGGQSEYDIGTVGAVGALEGYFRVVHVVGVNVEAEDLISEARVYPIIFPEEIASRLRPNYLINLEIVRRAEGWQIVSCGFAYPPNTEL